MLVFNPIIACVSFVLSFSSILSVTIAVEKITLGLKPITKLRDTESIDTLQARGFFLPFKPFKKPSKKSNSTNQITPIFNKPSKLSIRDKLTTTSEPTKPSIKPTVQDIVTTPFVPVVSTPSTLYDEVSTTVTIDVTETEINTPKDVDDTSELANSEQFFSEFNAIENDLYIYSNNETTEGFEEYTEKPESNSTDFYTSTLKTEDDSWVTVNSNQHTAENYCKQRNGFYEIPGLCDSYIECRNLVPTTHLCPDGLFFNPSTLWPDYPCSYPSEVQCDVEIKQIQVSTKACAHQYGIFASPNNCSQYVVCTEGVASVMNCPPGLAFNTKLSSCDWPENIPGCTPTELVGTTCSDDSDSDYKYRYKKSCSEYIMCQHGHSRLLKCDFGLSFDEDLQMCVDSEKVHLKVNCNKI